MRKPNIIYENLKTILGAIILATATIFAVSFQSKANTDVLVSNCKFTNSVDDHCFASGGGVSYDISFCVYSSSVSSCGITPVEPQN